MPSSTLTLYYGDSSSSLAFPLVSTSATGSTWRVASRGIGIPYSVTTQRKLGAPGALSNDKVTVQLKRVENNATTGKPATFVATLDLSIPRDTSIITLTEQARMVKFLTCIGWDNAAGAATVANATALLTGGDL